MMTEGKGKLWRISNTFVIHFNVRGRATGRDIDYD